MILSWLCRDINLDYFLNRNIRTFSVQLQKYVIFCACGGAVKILCLIVLGNVVLCEYRFKEAVDGTMHLAAQGNVLFQQCEPWKTIKEDPTRCQNDLFQCLQLLKAIAILLEPVMPTVAEKLWQQLGETGNVHETSVQHCLEPLTSGTKLSKPKVLFQKLDDETIEQMTAKLNTRIKSAVAQAK